MKRPTYTRLILFLALLLGSPLAALAASPRPANWAAPVDGVDIANLYRVESGLFRSAQPSRDGLRRLTSLGVKTVLDVAGGDGDGPLAQGTSLKLLHIPMHAWGLRDDLVLAALRILTDPANRPVLIHCHQGADRTGAIVAMYRIVVQGWSKEDAIREMDQGGFHHSFLWSNLDRYVGRANIAALRKELGIVALTAPLTAQAEAAAPPISASPARDRQETAATMAAPIAASDLRQPQ